MKKRRVMTAFAFLCTLMLLIPGGMPVTKGEGGPGSGGGDGWKSAYRTFFVSGEYQRGLQAADLEYAEIFAERDTQWDSIALHDMDGDGMPELVIRSDYAIEQADVFACRDGSIVHAGTMGGDNFFQWIISYRDSGYRGLFTVMGGHRHPDVYGRRRPVSAALQFLCRRQGCFQTAGVVRPDKPAERFGLECFLPDLLAHGRRAGPV